MTRTRSIPSGIILSSALVTNPSMFGDSENIGCPLHVWSNAAAGTRSARTSDGTFSVTTDDRGYVYHDRKLYILRGCTPLHMIHGDDHLLVSDQLRLVLASTCRSSVRFRPCVVLDSFDRRRIEQYQELTLPVEITPETLMSVDSSGVNAWHFGANNLFVTRLVMQRIKAAGILGLIFSPGFESFLGIAGTGC